MHSPSYFLGLLAAACSMNSIAQAGPVQKRNTLALPPFFQPPSVPLPLPAVAPAAFAALERVDLEQATSTAAHQLAAGLKINASDVIVSNSHFADGINHVYFTQAFNGLPIANAVSNANLDAFGNVISIYQSFAPAQMIESATAKFVQKRDQPTISIKQAIQAFAEVKGFSTSDKLVVTEKAKNEFSVSGASFVKFGDIRGSQKYYQTQAGLVLVWDLVIKTNPVW
ncbi:hypothetical protein BDR26DRAFT_892076 [Obelidium mucronatum]|nr:hypothetical protein BDR26DRAFT_892076 [Obelidium mucronatum]